MAKQLLVYCGKNKWKACDDRLHGCYHQLHLIWMDSISFPLNQNYKKQTVTPKYENTFSKDSSNS